MRRRPAGGGEALSAPTPIDPSKPPPRRLLRGTEQLAGLVGQRLLVGVTYLDPAGAPLSTSSFCGRVVEVADGVVVVQHPEDGPVVLPADAEAYEPAARGVYRLHDSGEAVVDPDWKTTWVVTVGS